MDRAHTVAKKQLKIDASTNPVAAVQNLWMHCDTVSLTADYDEPDTIMWREEELSWDFDMENFHKSNHLKDRAADMWIILKLLKEIHNRICAEYNKQRIRFSAGTLNLWVLTAEIGQVNEKHVPKNAVTEDIMVKVSRDRPRWPKGFRVG